MSVFVVPLEKASDHAGTCGGKAAALARMIGGGLRVPGGFCVTSDAYERFIDETGLRGKIALELGRKRLEEMRWEEMWDAALRIRNMFLQAALPDDIGSALIAAAGPYLPGVPLAVRSASLAEDSAGTSFAGLHESYLNVRGEEELLDRTKLVWASLWSDAALSYSRELSLDAGGSSMAVVVQEMVFGRKSGVAFGADPRGGRRAIVEAVYGLNKGLVDGDIEADRYILDRRTGEVISSEIAEHELVAAPAAEGVIIEPAGEDLAGVPVLDSGDIGLVFDSLMKVEEMFGSPQDMEWTIRDGELFVLQSRPITTARSADPDERRSYDLSLRRSLKNLESIRERIERELVPAMIAEAEEEGRLDLAAIDDEDLALAVERRSEAMERWRGVYWEDFIPFAHGVRLFGRIYNDRLRPNDPFEFVDLLAGGRLESTERNRRLSKLAGMMREAAELEGDEKRKAGEEIERVLEGLVEEFAGLSCSMAACDDEKESLRTLAEEMSRAPAQVPSESAGRRTGLEEAFLGSFTAGERGRAGELLDLARASYRLRDDDNIYLGRFESNLVRALEESRRRLGARCAGAYACTDAEEVIRALRFDDYEPGGETADEEDEKPAVRARRLRGQPAGPGVAEGPARVIDNASDLFEVRRGDVLVCDAIDPNMTFVVPLVSGIVERRGGMLIHGAIIAREYGLPCVTGIADATRLIENGDIVTVDGYFGLVIIHDRE
mgnify:CR=1 FL=1